MEVGLNFRDGIRVVGIARRACHLFPDLFSDEIDLCQALFDAHKICFLDFKRLLSAEKDELRHDISGIMLFFDRQAEEFVGGFWPKHALLSLDAA